MLSSDLMLSVLLDMFKSQSVTNVFGGWALLQRSPRPLTTIGGGVLLLRGGKGRLREKWRGRDSKGGIASSLFNFWLQA